MKQPVDSSGALSEQRPEQEDAAVERRATKVLFLDIDGVLNSHRSCFAFGGFPHCFNETHMARFDHVAVGLVRRLCEETGASIVLSSTWRLMHSVHEVANGLNLPVFAATPELNGPRGKEIAAFLAEHPHITRYAIVDDDSDMLPEQMPFFVKTPHSDGLTFGAYKRLVELLTPTPDSRDDSGEEV